MATLLLDSLQNIFNPDSDSKKFSLLHVLSQYIIEPENILTQNKTKIGNLPNITFITNASISVQRDGFDHWITGNSLWKDMVTLEAGTKITLLHIKMTVSEDPENYNNVIRKYVLIGSIGKWPYISLIDISSLLDKLLEYLINEIFKNDYKMPHCFFNIRDHFGLETNDVLKLHVSPKG